MFVYFIYATAWYIYVGLASSDTYMKLAREQELELSYIYVCVWCIYAVVWYIYVGLASSDTYMKLAKEQELERESRRRKKALKQRTSRSSKHGRHKETRGGAADDDREDDVPVLHVVSTAIDAPEVLLY